MTTCSMSTCFCLARGWMAFLATAVGSLRRIDMPVIQAFVSKLVPKGDVGKLLSFLGVSFNVVILIGIVGSGAVFYTTVGSLPQHHLPRLRRRHCRRMAHHPRCPSPQHKPISSDTRAVSFHVVSFHAVQKAWDVGNSVRR